MTTIRNLTPDIVTFSAPFNRFGLFKIGARATAVRLENNDVLVFSAIPSEPKILDALARLGRVKYLVAPDVEHHLSLEEYARLFPDAKLVGVQGVQDKHPDLKFHKIFGEKRYDEVSVGWEGEIETAYFPGHVNSELVVLHKKSRTMVEADALFNLPGFEQYQGSSSSAGLFGWLSPFRFLSAHGKAHQHFNWYMLAKDKPSFKRSLGEVAKWDFERIIPCHGEVIEENARAVWQHAFAHFETKGKDL